MNEALHVIYIILAYEGGGWLYRTGKQAWKKWRSTRGPLRNRKIGFTFADEVDNAPGSPFDASAFDRYQKALDAATAGKRAHGAYKHGKGHSA